MITPTPEPPGYQTGKPPAHCERSVTHWRSRFDQALMLRIQSPSAGLLTRQQGSTLCQARIGGSRTTRPDGQGVSLSKRDSRASKVQWLPAGIGMGNRLDVSCNAHSAVPPAAGGSLSRNRPRVD